MAAKKTDSFFIRGKVQMVAAGTYTSNEIDLGAFVDALGESVLRIHNIQCAICDDDSYMSGPLPASSGGGLNIGYQLTTSNQDGLVLLDDKSVVASGKFWTQYVASGTTVIARNDWVDVGPQEWTNGYLVGVDTLYLASEADGAASDGYYVMICMECTSEKLSKSSAMALALSQQ